MPTAMYSQKPRYPTRLDKECGFCHVGFSVPPSWAFRKYCSQSCSADGSRKPSRKTSTFNCETCGKTVTRNTCGPRQFRFCSLQCRRWKNGTGESHGYRTIHVTGRGTRNNRCHEHTLIAEKALGRQLKGGEVVHHVNTIRDDNRNSNLLICTNGYHQWLHAEMSRRYAREKFGGVV